MSDKDKHNGDGHDNNEPSWFEKPKNINLLIGALVLTCIGLVLADLMYHNDHPHFPIEKTFGFQAWFGFAAFVIVVFLGRGLRLIVKRGEDYYD